jgi:hypothetical protein
VLLKEMGSGASTIAPELKETAFQLVTAIKVKAGDERVKAFKGLFKLCSNSVIKRSYVLVKN